MSNVGDINGLGYDDIVVCNFDDDEIIVFLNDVNNGQITSSTINENVLLEIKITNENDVSITNVNFIDNVPKLGLIFESLIDS